MRLAQRLLLGTVVLIALLVLAVVLLAGSRLQARLSEQQREELEREALLVSRAWTPAANPDSLADIAGTALGYRVTLVDSAGVVIGDSEFDAAALAALENHGSRPEIVTARATGAGTSTRVSPSAGDEEMYVAVRHPLGVVRLSLSTHRVAETVSGARRDVIFAGVLAFVGALFLAGIFAWKVSRPIEELRDVASRIAGGDLAARPAIAAPGEVGDLATALHQMAEQLARRLAALREDDERLTALVESLNEGVLAIGPRGDVQRINGRGREFLRFAEATPSPAERLPRNAVLRQVIDAAMRGTAVEPMELQLFGRTLAVTARPLETGGAVVALFDLTPIRRLETMRRDFVANVSHELKTPLTVVRGFAETLLDEGITETDRERFSHAIAVNAERMQRIVDDLLDLSRIESGVWMPNPSWTDLGAVVADTFTALRPSAEAKGIALEASLDADEVYADPTALRQVVSNLVENAVRYTAAGDVTVESHATEGGVTIAVRDTGVGIAPEYLPRIFERFYRVDPARSRTEGGTGLGLSIVKHLVEAHGGRTSAESTVGAGTTISVYWPGPE